MKDRSTKRIGSKASDSDMKPEYDFSRGVRGKYAAAYRRGTNLILLDPEVAAAFPDSNSVNDALRALLAIAQRTKAPRAAVNTDSHLRRRVSNDG